MSFTLFGRTSTEPEAEPTAPVQAVEGEQRPEDAPEAVAAPVELPRLTPDGHFVEPNAIAQGYGTSWPELRVEAVYVTVEPDTFRGRVLCGGVELGSTEVVDFEPNAIRLAEQLIVDAVGKLFQQP